MNAQPFFWNSSKEKKDALRKIEDRTLNLVIHGAHGTGRSHLIDLIYHSLREKCEVRCISTVTLISLFKETESWLEESVRLFDTIILDDFDILFSEDEHVISRFRYYFERFVRDGKRLIISISTCELNSVSQFLPRAFFEKIELNGVMSVILKKIFLHEVNNAPAKFSDSDRLDIFEKKYANYHEFKSILSIAIFNKRIGRL